MQLATREKIYVSIALVAVAIFVLLQFIVFPFFKKKGRIERGISKKEEAFKKIVLLSEEYQSYKKGSLGIQQILAERNKRFTLFSFLEGAAGDVDIKGRIKYMKPSVSAVPGQHKESLVEMKLEEITLKQLIDYLYRVESPEKVVSIKRISIKENKKKPGHMDAILQVLTFK